MATSAYMSTIEGQAIAKLENEVTHLKRKNRLMTVQVDAMAVAFTQSFKCLFRSLQSMTPDHMHNENYFNFIPFRPNEAAALLYTANEFLPWCTGRRKFLDVGCGLGNIMILANRYFEVYGVEFASDYVKAAREKLPQIIGINPSNIIHADALSYCGYGSFDVVYFYRPIKDSLHMETLVKRITRQMKSGAILIPIGVEYLTTHSCNSDTVHFGNGIKFKRVHALSHDYDSFYMGNVFMKMETDIDQE